jgi:hypothetical protein
VGEHVLNAVQGSDPRVDAMKHDLAARRAAVESAARKASEAMEAGDWRAAIDFISSIGRSAVQDAALRRLCGRVEQHATAEITSTIESGTLDRVPELLLSIAKLPIQCVQLESLRTTIEQLRTAFESIESNRPHEAEEMLRQLRVAWPKAIWLNDVIAQTRQLAEARSAIRGSPLSLIALTPPRAADPDPVFRVVQAGPRLTPVGPPPLPVTGSTPGSFCLHVDGIGSYQVFTADRVSLGPVSGSRSVDLPLMLDPSVPTVTISRSDEDYFIKAGREVLVNDVPVVSRLLSDGDRIGLGSRCRITFRRPSAASTTVVLEFSGTRLPDSTVRRVLLMGREIIIGPHSSAHVRADELAAPMVLQRRGEQMICRSGGQICIDGNPMGNTAEVLPGCRVSLGSLRFVIAREKRP